MVVGIVMAVGPDRWVGAVIDVGCFGFVAEGEGLVVVLGLGEVMGAGDGRVCWVRIWVCLLEAVGFSKFRCQKFIILVQSIYCIFFSRSWCRNTGIIDPTPTTGREKVMPMVVKGFELE